MQNNQNSMLRSLTVRPAISFKSALFAVLFVNICLVLIPSTFGQRKPFIRPATTKTVENKSAEPEFKALDTQPLVTWNNGNVLPGRLSKATESRLLWNSDLFRGDLKLDFNALNNVRFPRDDERRSTEEKYLVRTVNGDKLYGKVTGVQDNRLTLESKRHGELSIELDKVARISDLENSGYVFMGISDLEDWRSLTNTKPSWKISDSGELTSNRSSTNLQLETELPEAVLIELVVRWDKNLDFTFGLGAPSYSRLISRMPTITTWRDALVLNHDDDFSIIYDSIDAKKKRLALQIQWNRKTNQITIYDEGGKELCQTKVTGNYRGIRSGIYLANKKGDLRVETLRISKMSAGYDPSQSGIQAIDGLSTYGKLTGFDGENWTVATDADDANDAPPENEEGKEGSDQPETRLIPAEKFRTAIMNLEPAPRSGSDNILLRFQDSSIISGKLVGVTDNRLSLQTELCDKPIASDLAGASIIRFLNDPKQVAKLKLEGKQRLFSEYGMLAGQVRGGSGKANDVIRWQPVGCDEGLPLSNGNSRILFSNEDEKAEKEKEKDDTQSTEWPDTIYLVNKDTIPCRVDWINENEIGFESFFENEVIDQSYVKAVDFSRGDASGAISALDPGWYFPDPANPINIKPKDGEPAENAEPAAMYEVVDENTLLIRSTDVFGHTSLATIGSLKFNIAWRQSTYNTLKVRQFLRSPGEIEGGIGVSIVMSDRTIKVGTLENERISRQPRVVTNNNQAEIEMIYNGKKLIVLVNGQEAYNEMVDNKLVNGTAISMNLKNTSKRGNLLTISNFTVDKTRSSTNNATVNQERLALLLTIPRLQKDNPPKHILCARNRDCLRGELTKMDQKEIKFESLRDEFTFERDLVSSIVWLHVDPAQLYPEDVKDEEEGEGEAGEDEAKIPAQPVVPESDDKQQVVQVLLRGGKRVTLNAKSWSDDTFEGVSESLGRCSVPVEEITELRLGKFASDATDVAYAEWVAIPARVPDLTAPEDAVAFGKTSELVGTPAKDFSLKLLDGSDFGLSEQKGKVVVLDFWATWNGQCVRSLPEMIEATSAFDPEQVVYVAVNQLEASELIKNYIEQKQWDMTVGLDNGDVGESFGVDTIPYTVIVDRQGKIAFVSSGSHTGLKNKMVKAIEEIAGSEALQN